MIYMSVVSFPLYQKIISIFPMLFPKVFLYVNIFSPKFAIYNIQFVVHTYTHTHTHTHNVQRERSPSKRLGGTESCLESNCTPTRDAQRA